MDPRVASMERIKAQFDEFFSVHFPDVGAAN
jgi:hypothetical protein